MAEEAKLATTKTTTFDNSAILTDVCADKGSLFPATGPKYAKGVSSRRRLEEADLVADMAVAITAFTHCLSASSCFLAAAPRSISLRRCSSENASSCL